MQTTCLNNVSLTQKQNKKFIYLNDNAIANGGLTVHLSDFGVAVLEAEQLDLFVNLQLADDRLLGEAGSINAAVHKCAPAAVESMQNIGRLMQDCIILSNEFSSNLLRARSCHDHDRYFFFFC